MAKENKKGAAKVVTLSPEEFQKLTPEDQAKYLTDVANATSALQSDNDKLAKDLKAAKAEATKDELPSFEVGKNDATDDVEAGEYQFTCPTFHWDDNTIIDVRELMAAAEGKDAKVAQKAQEICVALVARKSGIIARKEA